MRRTFLQMSGATPAAQWLDGAKATARRQELYGLLGDLPPRGRPTQARRLATEDRGAFLLERLELDLNGIQKVPAYFLMPKNARGRVPAVLFNHWHAGEYKLGKDELLRPKPAVGLPCYADSLIQAGYAVLAIDSWLFGERSGVPELDLFKEMLWKGQVLWGMMVYDSLKAYEYLLTRDEVNVQRTATLGMSMGSTMAWWLAALEPRIKATVDICCLTDFQALMDRKHLKGHGIYYYVPGLLKHFTAAQINALIAPRAHLALAGNLDPLTPPEGLDRIDRELRTVYQAAGKPEHWRLRRYEVAHSETSVMRREWVSFLGEFL